MPNPHTFTGDPLLPYVQAMLLARFIRKDIDDYPVFLIK